MWYFQITDETGQIIYNEERNMIKFPDSVQRNLFHATAITMKKSLIEKSFISTENTMTFLKNYNKDFSPLIFAFFIFDSLYFKASEFCSQLCDSIFCCIVTICGYIDIENYNAGVKKKIQVFILFIFF